MVSFTSTKAAVTTATASRQDSLYTEYSSYQHVAKSSIQHSSIAKGDCTELSGANGPIMRRHARFVHVSIDGRNTPSIKDSSHLA